MPLIWSGWQVTCELKCKELAEIQRQAAKLSASLRDDELRQSEAALERLRKELHVETAEEARFQGTATELQSKPDPNSKIVRTPWLS